MASVTRTTTWVDNQVLSASALNGEFNNLLNALNIVNADVAAGAGIVESKITFSGSGHGHAGGTDGKLLLLPTQTYTPSASGTATLDLSLYKRHVITMPAGNITIALSGATTTEPFIVEIIQDSVGSRTITWFTTIKWAGGSAPTLTTTANKKDTFGFIVTGTGTYDGYVVGQNL